MGNIIRVQNDSAYRVFDPSGAATTEVGDPSKEIRLVPISVSEFVLRVGMAGDVSPCTDIHARECAIETVDAQDSQSASIVFRSKNPDLRICVRYSVGSGSRLRKALVVENVGDKAVVLFDVVLEAIRVADDISLSGGGRGWPVFIEGIGYAAVEFPESDNIVSDHGFSLEYYPAVTIGPGETYESEAAILEFSRDPESALRDYVSEIRARKSGDLFCHYSTWGAHEYEGPNERIVNEQIDQLTDLRRNWRVPFEYFTLDYGYWSDQSDPLTTGDYTRIDDRHRFPNGSFDRIVSRLQDSGLKLGMWFGLGCPARREFINKLKRSIAQMSSKYGLKLARLDLADWDCSESSHSHLPGKYMRYLAARNLMELISAVRGADHEMVIVASSLSRSPWWLKHVDFVMAGRRDPADIPAPSLRESQILHTDLDHRFFELDAGTQVTYSDAHFWCGKQNWRKSVVMSVSRSNQLLLSGELHLLDEDDRLFLERVTHMRRAYGASNSPARQILGDPSRCQVYGYRNTLGGRGLVAVYNPSWESRLIDATAADLGFDPSVRNVCIQLYPDTEVSAIPAEGGHLHIHIDPWEVLWLEVGPSDEHCELLESSAKANENCPMYVSTVSPPSDVESRIVLPLERTYFHSGCTHRARTRIPQTWGGFPLLIDLNGFEGELYMNNRCLGLYDSTGFALLYPWTRTYGLIRFGRENLIYLSTRKDLQEQQKIALAPVPYFSSSACREDWPHPGDATAVVIVRYTQEGKPLRHSSDPRLAQCAVWLDGVWMEPYRVPPIVPRIWSGYSWAVFMLDLEGDWECVRILVPRLLDCDYDVDFFITDRLTAFEYAQGQ